VNVLLDTCAVIWSASATEELSDRATAVLEDSGVETFVSALSCAEIACLCDRERILLDRHWKIWFNAAVEVNQWQVLPIGLDEIQEAYSLPDPFHRDPADRILTATARLHGMSIVTADQKILSYPHVDSIW
jgi:PIN domain nuclease of toxin-antitoxin system